MAKASDAAAGTASTGVDLDSRQRELLKSAARKRQAGQGLTQAEERSLRRFEQQQRERHGQEYCRSLPKAHYLAATGVANKVILEQAQKLDLPWKPHEKSVDLFAMVAAFHRLITSNPKGFYRLVRTDAMKEFFPDEDTTDWQDECFKEKAWQLGDQRRLRRGEMLDAAAVAEIHARLAERFRSFSETLGQRFGEAAQRLWLQAWEDQQTDILSLLEGTTDDGRGDE